MAKQALSRESRETTLNPRTGKMETMSETLNNSHKENERLLKQKMAKQTAGAAPSLDPTKSRTVAPPPPEAEEVIPSIDDLIPEDDVKAVFRSLVSQQVSLKAQIKPLEAALEPIGNRIKTWLSSYGITKTICDGAKISYTGSERRTINRNKLIAAGVDELLIDECSDISISSILKITPPKA